MNKAILILFISAWGFTAFGQDKADSLFTTAGQLYTKRDYIGAVNCFKEIVLNHKDFKYYDQSVYNLAYTYNEIPDSLDQALFWYEKVRASKVKDDERVGGRGIFEPYANYKHYATFNIATIEYNRGNYEKALDYYRQCLTHYPYVNKSATDLRINKNRLTVFIVDCLKGLKKYGEALATIIPETLDSYGTSNYPSIVESAMSLIEENYDKQQIATELEAAFKTLKQDKNKYHFTFTWRNATLDLVPYIVSNAMTVETFIAEIKQSDFWKELTQ